MTTRHLRYVSIGITATVAGFAWADTIYMQSASDGAISFHSFPATPRFGSYSNSDRLDRRRRQREKESGDPCSGILCDKSRFDQLINDVAQGYGIDSALLHAVITVESSYNPSARGPNGAAGLMQLMPGTAKRYGVVNAYDPEQNLRGGAKYLRDLLEMFGSDIRLAIAAYQAGENTVSRYQNTIPPFRATVEYVAKVLDYYHKFRAAAAH